MKEYRLRNLERENARTKKWQEENKEKFSATLKAYAKAHPEVNKAAAKRQREKHKNDPVWHARKAEWAKNKRLSDPEAAREKSRKYATAEYERRYGKDTNYTLRRKLRCTVVKRLKQQDARKTASTFDLIGCSIDELKLHLQKQFQPGMHWNNYGYRGWHIDHRIPLSSFDLLDPAQQKLAFSYQNLQPLWAAENMAKGAKKL